MTDTFINKHRDVTIHFAIVNAHSVREGIEQYVLEAEADLVALITHGREGVEHILEGSIAEHLVNRSSTPVLTYNLRTTEVVAL
jgi:nucleotide-binding universal stress UspA family protein